MEYKYLAEPLIDYIKNLSAKTPCPGGGSASILSLSLANALILMVCNFTAESKKVSETSKQVSREIISKASNIQRYLNSGIEQDSTIYQKIQETSKLARKNLEDQKPYQDALKDSIELHMKILDFCSTMLEWNEILIEKGNPYLISDIGVSSSLILGTIEATRINILINLCEVIDKRYVSESIAKVRKLSESLSEYSQRIISDVEKKIVSNIKNMEEK